MSKTILAAMRKHKTPTEFIQRFVLPSIKRGAVPNLARMVAAKKRKRFEELALPKGTEHTIVFADRSNPNHICYFQIDTTLFKGEAKLEPKMKLFNQVHTRVGREDFESAEKHTGTEHRKHSSRTEERTPSTSINLLFSHDWLNHWPEKDKIIAEFGEKKRTNYLVDHETFEELNKYRQAIDSIHYLAGAIRVISGKESLQHFVRENRLDKKFPNMDAIDAFSIITSPHHSLFRKLVNAESESEASQLIFEHFKISKLYAQRLARSIMKILMTTGGRNSAMELAKKFRK